MVAYPPDVEAAEDLAYQLAMNSFLTLFWRQSVLAQTCAWLSAHAYQLVEVSCGRWHTADDMFRDIATAFDFPDYFGANLSALNDCLSDVVANDYGADDQATGTVLVLTHFDAFAKAVPAMAEALLDIFASVVLRTVAGVKALQHAQAAVRRANHALSRTKPGSNGRRSARARLVKVHARVANIRAATAHEVSSWCAKNLTRLTVEDLNVAGMIQLRSLARAVSDAGMGELARMIRYKAGWYGLQVSEADRWFPSSKTCSGCGNVKTDLTLSDRTYQCDPCGLVIDRDVNAAVNLARWPDRNTSAPPAADAERAA